MNTMHRILVLAILALAPAVMEAQNTEQDLQAVLQKLDRGESAEHMLIQLSDINFATGTANLEPAAKSYLDQVAKLLRSVPNMNLMIGGHADNTGSAAVNERLSSERANAVQNYLIVQRIAASRLQAKGFGSSAPVAENTTPEGRAKNRRVALEILKTETVKSLQDVIVLRDGTRLGVIVRNYDLQLVHYRQFTDATERQIATEQVEKIIFADGREVRFDRPAAPAKPLAQSKPKSQFKFALFEESEAFHPGQFVFGLGLGLENNIGIRYRDQQVGLPPVWAVLELPLQHNLGIGISGGAMMWSPKENQDGAQFIYYSIAPRAAYHFNLGPRVDLYTGLSVNARFVHLKAEREGTDPLSITNHRIDAGFFGGLRFYFNRFFGLYGEYGNDNVACARLGISMRFGQ